MPRAPARVMLRVDKAQADIPDCLTCCEFLLGQQRVDAQDSLRVDENLTSRHPLLIKDLK